jgi:RimJ/RimL family protein N-acetyltransferase
MIAIPRLEDDHVRLEPLSIDHVPALTLAANEDRSTFDLAPVPRDEAAMKAYVEAALADRAAFPFALVQKGGGARVVGATRLINLEWWSWPAGPAIRVEGEPRRRDAGDPPDVVEIGSVWIARSAQRTVVNSAACLLLMRQVFEAWRVHRLVLKTDARNTRSRNAILRVGGQFEGILRKHLPAADGVVRDTAMFSIVAAEWPEVERRLSEAVKGRPGGGAS